ncbi:MAG: HlyD family secretion protein [Nitrospira sp.]|nr:HlyD family secretion protein [Nitrospira sp.]
MTSEEQTIPSDPTRARRNRWLLLWGLVFSLMMVSYGVHWWMVGRFRVETHNAFVAGNLVPVTAQVSGIITNVLAEETQFVNKGDLVMTLEANEAAAKLGQARGHLGETVRRIAALFITKLQLTERLEARRARLDIVRHDMDRYRHVSPHGGVAKQIVQNAEDELRALEAEVRESQAEADTIEVQVGSTTVMEHPAVELAKHEFIEAHLYYSRQQIRAPVSGSVAKRKGQVGDRVAPGFTLMTVVSLEHLWVEANLRETELAHVRPGQQALISVDMYGRQYIYHGTVEGLVPGAGSVFATLPPDNATGNFIHIVQRVPVRIALPKEELLAQPIRPGLSTVTRIDIREIGQSMWTSLTETASEEYHTDLFEDELQEAEAQAQEVIRKNLPHGQRDRLVPE